MYKLKKKIFSIMSVLLMIFTCFIPTTTKAAGNHTLASGYYPGYSYQFKMSNGFDAWGQGFWLTMDGKPVFCVDIKTQFEEGGGSGYTESDFTHAEARTMSLIAYYGWEKHKTAPDAINWRLATQYMIYETMGHTPVSITGFDYPTYKTQIQNEINRHNLRPSFHSGNYEVNVNESITLTDTNGVLSEFAEVGSQNGVNVVRNGNSLTITPTDSAPENVTLRFAKIPQSRTGTSIVYHKSDNLQDVAEFYVVDPNYTGIQLKVNKEGSLKIAKQDEEGNYVPNTSFALSYNSDMSDPIGTYKTGSDGTVQIDDLLPKDLYVQETNVPANLVLDPKIYKVTIIANDVVSFNAKNAIQKGNITLKKQDADTGNIAQGDATLAGAVYGLYARENIVNPISGKLYHAKDTLVAQTTTDPLGNTAGFLNQNLGAYYIQEIQAPTGYQLDPNKYNVDLAYGGQTVSVVTQNMTVSDQVITGKIEIHKYSDEETSVLEPEPNAEFTVILKKYVEQYGSFEEALKHLDTYSKKEYAILTTDKTGYASSGELAAGDYVMKQTKTPHVDLIPMEGSLEFTISTQDQSFHYAIKNEWKKAYLRLIKLDADTEEPITLSNASFKIWNVKKQAYVKQKVGEDWIDTFTTNKKGQVTLPLMLLAGEYEAREITAPNGYLLNTDPIPFTITGSIMEADDDGDPLIIVRVKDEKPTAEIHIEKADEETKELLSGVQYQLKTKYDIIDPQNGKVIHQAGDPVSMDISEDGYYMTNELGEIHIVGLPLGTDGASYLLQETRTLDGYVLDETVYEIKFDLEDDQKAVYEVHKQFTNKQTEVIISKTDLTTGKELEGATLQVLDENGKVVEEWISTEEAHVIKGLTVGKEYTLKETIAPFGYMLSEKEIKFTVANTTETQKVEMTNDYTKVEILKVDETTGKVLAGADFILTSEKTKNIVERWTSTEEAHMITMLEPGMYRLHEETAPYGYHLAEDVIFEVKATGEIQKVVMKDEQILTDIQVQKVDAQTDQLIRSKDFAFTMYEDEGCKKEVRTVHADQESGTATFEDITYGVYYIKETQAPIGYLLSDEVLKVEINEEGVFFNDELIDPDKDIYSYRYLNELVPSVPTGDDTNQVMLWMLLFGALAGLSATFCYFKNSSNSLSK